MRPRYALSFLLLLAFPFAAPAQEGGFRVAYSEPFTFPKDLVSAQVFQCSNGASFLLQYAKRSTVISYFDKSRKAGRSLTLPYNMVFECGTGPHRVICHPGPVVKVCQIGSEMAIFLSGGTSLKRVTFNIESGEPMGEFVYTSMQPGPPADGWKKVRTLDYSILTPPEPFRKHFVETDEETGCYAVALWDNAAADPQHRITVEHYTPTHRLLGRYFVDPPDQQSPLNRYFGMTVKDSAAVYVLSHAYVATEAGNLMNAARGNSYAASAAGSNKYYLSVLKQGGEGARHVLLGSVDKVLGSEGILLAGKDKLYILLLSKLEESWNFFSSVTTSGYGYRLMSFDPATMELSSGTDQSLQLVTDGRNAADRIKGFEGLPMDMELRPDGKGVNLMLEDFTNYRTRLGKKHEFGDAGVLTLSERLGPEAGYAAPKSQFTNSEYIPLYMHHRRARPSDFAAMDCFDSYQFLATPTSAYLLFNDHKENFQARDGKGPALVEYLCEMEPVIYQGNEKTFERQHLFTATSPDRTIPLCVISSGHFNPTSGTYAVLVADMEKKKEKDKGVYLFEMRGSLAWVDLK